MFDTMTLTKIIGSLCGALLIFLFGSWAADTIYFSSAGGSEHEESAVVYPPAVEGEASEETEVAAVDFSEILAMADIAKGQKIFKKCSACHKTGAGENSTGPALYGVVDRAAGSVEGYGYSDALAAVGNWTPENLEGFLESPKKFAPGTKMAFNGLAKIEDRANVIAYLDSLDD